MPQFSSVAQSCPTYCDPMDCSTPGLPVYHQLWNLLKLMSIKSVMPSNHLILCRFLLLPSIFPSIRVIFNELDVHIRWPEYWRFGFSISPFNEYSGLTSYMIDWFDLLAVQETLKSFLHHHSSKASFLWCSDFSHIRRWHWKDHSVDYMDIFLAKWSLCFLTHCLGLS